MILGPLDQHTTSALVMDLDGVCYDMLQPFMDWVNRTQFDVHHRLAGRKHFRPYRYDFWHIFGENADWWQDKFPLFLQDVGLSDIRHTIHGTGLAMWRFANAHDIPVAVVTARHNPPVDTATMFSTWAWDEGLVYDLYIETTPGESKADALRMHLNPDYPPATVVAIDDSIDNVNDYRNYGYDAYLVDRPWNDQPEWSQLLREGRVLQDSCIVSAKYERVHVAR